MKSEKDMIKKVIKTITITLSFALVFSCATTKSVKPAQQEDEALIQDNEEVSSSGKVIREPKLISVQNTSNQKEADYKEIIDTLDIKITARPKVTFVDKAFSQAYSILVKNKNGVVPNFDITVNWPTGRSNDVITYGSAQIKTNADGVATFTPGTPRFAVNDYVTFYPTPISSSSNIVQDSYDVAQTAPYQVKSNYIQYPGGILYAYDFNEKGNPTSNNFTLLQTLRNAGVNVGNSPISDTSYFDKSEYALYKATYDIVGNSYKFMVIGAFKYTGETIEDANGASVTLTADITCVDMKNGAILYKTSFSETTTDKNKWNAEQKCRKILAEKAADAIVYSM